VKTITIRETDDRYTIRELLRRADGERVLVILPWSTDRGWQHPLDYEIQRRLAEHKRLEMAWVIEDPWRRNVARKAGLPTFSSEGNALEYLSRHGTFPPVKATPPPPRPRRPWWAPTPRRPKAPPRHRPPLWVLLLESIVLFAVLGILVGVWAFAVPSAEVTLYPSTISYARLVPVSVDPTLDEVDLEHGVIPSTRVGDEFEGYAEVVTTGRGYAFSGRATGKVLLTNLLGQDYQVPAGTIVRTSGGSYPSRYATTQDVTIPAFGQAEVPVEALLEGPRGNVDAYQVNLVEGVAGFAVRVTNPEPITGAESKIVRIVSQADRDRAWELAAQQVMANAYNGLQELATQEPGRFLPRQSLVIQAAPHAAYTHVVGERTDVLGLTLRLLVTGEAIRVRDAQAVAYRRLLEELPAGYTLIDARYEFGEAAEEDIGPGVFTFFVTAHGYAAARIDRDAVLEMVRGIPVTEAYKRLESSLSLAAPPEIIVSPKWFPYVPFLPIRIQVNTAPGQLPARAQQ